MWIYKKKENPSYKNENIAKEYLKNMQNSQVLKVKNSLLELEKYLKDFNKIGPGKNTWYEWLINYVPEPIRKSVAGFKDKIFSLFRTNTSEQTVYERGENLSEEDYYKPERVNKFWNNNYIEYESNGDKK